MCKERWGITPLQVFIHRDEGHYSDPEDIATWKPNLHAHIVWDWMNHKTGKSCKLDEKAMCEMQTVLAECLEMQRASQRSFDRQEHLERNDFIIAKQKQEAEQVKTEKKRMPPLAAKEKAETDRTSPLRIQPSPDKMIAKRIAGQAKTRINNQKRKLKPNRAIK